MDISGLLLICILSGIAATGLSISCVTCVAENEKKCQGIAQECPPNTNECISVLELTRIGTKRQNIKENSFFMRLCGNCSNHKTGSVRFDKGILRINATCCNTDNCTPTVPTIPPEKHDEKVKLTAIRCRSCYAYNPKVCECNVFINCTAGETNCISRNISASDGAFQHGGAIRGCATKEMCEVPPIDQSLNNTKVKLDFTCTNDSDSFHKSLILLLLIGSLFSMVTVTT